MRRNATILFGAIGLALTLGAGSVGAAAINCETSTVSNVCWGTEESDKLVGTTAGEVLVGLGGDGADNLHGDGSSVTFAGNDTLAGGPSDDRLWGNGGNDRLNGGSGNDTIDATEGTDRPAGRDSVNGGAGNDTITANDGRKDVIDCGKGRDEVTYDRGLDTVTNCETKHPV